MITNNINKKRYVGKSKNLLDRIDSYGSLTYLMSKPNSKICKALMKFGYANFSFTIIEHCHDYMLSKREQHFINTLKPQYNIRKSV